MRASEPLHVCLVGCGAMGAIHAQNLATDPRVARLTACDASPERAQALANSIADRGPIVETARLEEAFSAVAPDAFLIVSPAAQHLDQLRAAAATGAYVFCEKPVAPSYAEIAPLMSELLRHNGRVQIGFNRRFDPHLAGLKARLLAGDAGQIEQLHLVSRDHKPPTLDQLPFSAGLIAETMIHDFDTVRWLLDDEIVSVFCTGAAIINPVYGDHGHIDTATTVLTGTRGQQVVIQNSWRSPNGYDQRIEAMGALGRLTVGNPRENLVAIDTRAGHKTMPISDDWSTRYSESYRLELREFVGCVAGKGAVSPSLKDGIAASHLTDRCAESLRTGMPQMVTAGP